MKLTITTKRSGPFTKRITVLTNDAKQQRATLECAGAVQVAFKMEPRTMLNTVSFSEIPRDAETRRKTVTITRGDGGPLAPELLPVDHANVQASLREIEPGERYQLDVDIRPPWPKNNTVRTNLTLKTGVSEAPQETIRVYARMARRLRAKPPRFSIPQNIRSTRDLKVDLVWSGGKPGRILEATSSDPQTTVRIEDKDGQQVLVLQVPPEYTPPARRTGFVTVKTDDPEAPQLRIPIYVRSSRVGSRSQVASPAMSKVKRPAAGATKPPTLPGRQPPKKPAP
ncbi:MAG: hypothetical protein ACE5I3_10080 [Phycisphaerae bacterium]